METKLHLEILPQPDDFTCGPTCLHATYNYFADDIALEKVIREVPRVEGGGTLAVLLGCHALRRDYNAKIYTYNLQVFDPTWFSDKRVDVRAKLLAQLQHKKEAKLQVASRAYIEFLELGGQILFEDMTGGLVRRYLKQSVPILAGLSATYLYRCAREFGPNSDYDDIRGESSGHFVVLCGYDREAHKVQVADPQLPNPVATTHYYEVNIDRLICAIMLGILTYDANFLIIEPRRK